MSDLVTTTPGQRTALTHVARGLHAKFQGVLGQETIEALVRLGQLQGIGRRSSPERPVNLRRPEPHAAVRSVVLLLRVA
jgi:hypothetical protein